MLSSDDDEFLSKTAAPKPAASQQLDEDSSTEEVVTRPHRLSSAVADDTRLSNLLESERDNGGQSALLNGSLPNQSVLNFLNATEVLQD